MSETRTLTVEDFLLARYAEDEVKRRVVEDLHRVGVRFPYEQDGAVLQLLALPYADHPDYRPEWRR